MAYQVYWGVGSAKWPMADGYYWTQKEATERAKLMRRRSMGDFKYAVKKAADPPGGKAYFQNNQSWKAKGHD